MKNSINNGVCIVSILVLMVMSVVLLYFSEKHNVDDQYITNYGDYEIIDTIYYDGFVKVIRLRIQNHEYLINEHGGIIHMEHCLHEDLNLRAKQ